MGPNICGSHGGVLAAQAPPERTRWGECSELRFPACRHLQDLPLLLSWSLGFPGSPLWRAERAGDFCGDTVSGQWGASLRTAFGLAETSTACTAVCVFSYWSSCPVMGVTPASWSKGFLCPHWSPFPVSHRLYTQYTYASKSTQVSALWRPQRHRAVSAQSLGICLVLRLCLTASIAHTSNITLSPLACLDPQGKFPPNWVFVDQLRHTPLGRYFLSLSVCMLLLFSVSAPSEPLGVRFSPLNSEPHFTS